MTAPAMSDLAQRLADAGIEAKPLGPWRDSEVPANGVCHAITTFGTYFIDIDCNDWFLVYPDSNGVGCYKTLEAAKSAAQADYEARILAALQVKEGRE